LLWTFNGSRLSHWLLLMLPCSLNYNEAKMCVRLDCIWQVGRLFHLVLLIWNHSVGENKRIYVKSIQWECVKPQKRVAHTAIVLLRCYAMSEIALQQKLGVFDSHVVTGRLSTVYSNKIMSKQLFSTTLNAELSCCPSNQSIRCSWCPLIPSTPDTRVRPVTGIFHFLSIFRFGYQSIEEKSTW
jgi:hypothetical protein